MPIEYIEGSWWVFDPHTQRAWEYASLWEAVIARIAGEKDGEEETFWEASVS